MVHPGMRHMGGAVAGPIGMTDEPDVDHRTLLVNVQQAELQENAFVEGTVKRFFFRGRASCRPRKH